MWVEIDKESLLVVKGSVILFVRMWVEISPIQKKWIQCLRHPLREDVSWNAMSVESGHLILVILFVRMWVEIIFGGITLAISIVILFVRMWVEMTMQQDQLHYLPSSSSWGCELKSEAEAQGYEPCSHPLREDVSWNACTSFPQEGQNTVILFVRMWVEISIVSSDVPSLSVILFVRMWVEI